MSSGGRPRKPQRSVMTHHDEALGSPQEDTDYVHVNQLRDYFHEDAYPSQVDGKGASQTTRRYYDGALVSAPNTPRKQSNFFMTLEVPLEIAQTTEMTWTMTPHGTPARPTATNNLDGPDTPGHSPVRPGPISTLHFGVKSPSKQPKLSTEDSDIFGDIVHRTETIKTESESAQPGTLSPPSSPPAVKLESPYKRSLDVPPSSSASQAARAAHQRTSTFGIPIYDNEIHEPDPSWPQPVYPRQTGEIHPSDPLPNFPLAPKKYYVVTKGLRLGVFYEEWPAMVPLCKNLKGGKGFCKGAKSLRDAIIEFEVESDKVLVPHLGYF